VFISSIKTIKAYTKEPRLSRSLHKRFKLWSVFTVGRFAVLTTLQDISTLRSASGSQRKHAVFSGGVLTKVTEINWNDTEIQKGGKT
jgi:hypothetical protein